MYEEYLHFAVIPNVANNEIRGLNYKYIYHGNEMCSMETTYFIPERRLYIESIQKGVNPSYESFGFSHLGTHLLIDTITYIHYRLEMPIEKITGSLSIVDKRNGNWDRSIPFYRDVCKYARNGMELSFYLKDQNGKIVHQYADEDMSFEYNVKWS